MKHIKYLLISLLLICSSVNFYLYSYIKTLHSQPVIPLDDLLRIRKDIVYIKLQDSVTLDYKKSPFSESDNLIWWECDHVVHPELFLLSIPQGYFYSQNELVIVDGMYVDELVWGPTKNNCFIPLVDLSRLGNPKKIKGKVAVLGQSGAPNYYHWMVEALPRLALLQKSGIEYDYVWIRTDYPFMKETLDILGIDRSKIIGKQHNYIQADELIVPSIPSAFGYSSEFVINFLREIFIPQAQENIKFHNFSKKVFISRKKAVSRKIVNEDDVFALFKEHGFVAYVLEDLSVLEQVALFYNAEIIVGEHGAGLTNIIFAQPGTKILEIFQARDRAMYWYLSQALDLDYSFIKTIEFDDKKNGNVHSKVPLDKIKNFINLLF